MRWIILLLSLLTSALFAAEPQIIMSAATSASGEEVTINMIPRNSASAPFLVITQSATSSGTGSMTYSLSGGPTKSGPWVTLCTTTLTLSTTIAADPCGVNFPYPFIRGDVTAISGTGATATMTLYRDGN